MALPININELVRGKVIEWDRLEFKAGWNPESILHTVCAFANDIHNWGGGYIIVGIDAVEGIAQFPVKGINAKSIDKIQGELISICYQIQPNYLPVSEPYVIDGKHILVIWVSAGDMRPYSCPSTQGKDARRQYYIRSGSHSIVPKGDNYIRLMEQTAKVPFDDRINQEAKLNDLEFGLIREFLQEIQSDLFEESTAMPFNDLCRAMQIARGPIEAFRPINAGLLFFNKNPHKFFNRAWIELAIHNDEYGKEYVSEIFKGPLHHQIRNCLTYLQQHVIRTETIKIVGKAESINITNYPFNAIEEALCNAIYHKSYKENKPIEIQVFKDKIEILSYPGPLPPITNTDLQKTRVIARDYRNRRIGDFLKELKLVEGKATGFPLIVTEMVNNGNPEPLFYTDEERILFLITLPCNPNLYGTKTSEEIQHSLNEGTKINPSKTSNIDKNIGTKIKTEKINVNEINSDRTKINPSKISNVGKNIGTKIKKEQINIDKKYGDRTKINSSKTSNVGKNIGTKIKKEKINVNEINSDRTKIKPSKISNVGKNIGTKIKTEKINIDKKNGDRTKINPSEIESVEGKMGAKLSKILNSLILFLDTEKSKDEILEFIGVTNKTDNFNRYIKPLMQIGLLIRTIPNKPNSKLQQYKLTAKGRKVLSNT